LESRLARVFLLVLRLARAILLEFLLASLAKCDYDKFPLAIRISSRAGLAKRNSNSS
jgi:hypothetical protein